MFPFAQLPRRSDDTARHDVDNANQRSHICTNLTKIAFHVRISKLMHVHFFQHPVLSEPSRQVLGSGTMAP
jgi:hypothetical protein